LNPKYPPKYKNPPIWTKCGFQVDYDVANWYPSLISYGGHFESKMAAKIQKSSDVDEIWFPSRLWCPELIADIEKFLTVPILKMATTIPHKFNIVQFQRHIICRLIMMSRIDSWHRKISTGFHFQNVHHNTAQIQHCSISKVAFDLFLYLFHHVRPSV
jgi:hypothetical protein